MTSTQAAPKDRLFSKDAVTRSDQMPPSRDTAPQVTRLSSRPAIWLEPMAVWELYLQEP